MFGCKNEADFASQSPATLSPEFQPDGKPSMKKAQEMMSLALKNGSHFFEWTHQKKTGEVFPASVLLSRVEDSVPNLLEATFETSPSKKIEKKI
ncbi:MAG: hypothetical protein WCJ29_05530 [bacterium]